MRDRVGTSGNFEALLTFTFLRTFVGIVRAVVGFVADPRDRYTSAIGTSKLLQRASRFTWETKEIKKDALRKMHVIQVNFKK